MAMMGQALQLLYSYWTWTWVLTGTKKGVLGGKWDRVSESAKASFGLDSW